MIIGVGTDIIEIERVKGAIERTHERLVPRLFTELERNYCERHKNRFQHYAGRFAAKEAAFKALGTGLASGIGWRDVEVQNASTGKPTLVLYGRAYIQASALGISAIHLSLSHSDYYAVAQVIMEG